MSRISDADERLEYRRCELAYTVAGSGEPVLWNQGTAVLRDHFRTNSSSGMDD